MFLIQFLWFWNVAIAREWDFTAQQFWWSWIFVRLRGNIAEDAMQMEVHKTLYPFYTTKKMPHVTVTITKNALLAASVMHISITTIYTVHYPQIFNEGHFFSSKHCHDLWRMKHWNAMVFNENINYAFIFLSNQGFTWYIQPNMFLKILRGIARLLSPDCGIS